ESALTGGHCSPFRRGKCANLLTGLERLDQVFHLVHGEITALGVLDFLVDERRFEHGGAKGSLRFAGCDADHAVLDEVNQVDLLEEKLQGSPQGNTLEIEVSDG